jgi:predicted DCC family thiol-disulfide oxidoreductase YuxK
MGASGSLTASNHKIILFDGVCNLCNGAVQFIIRRDRKKIFQFASLQSDFARQLLSKTPQSTFDLSSILVVVDNSVYDRSDAVLKICSDLEFPWKALSVFSFLPITLRDFFYNIVSRNRYRWFGKQDSCMLPTPELRARFIE